MVAEKSEHPLTVGQVVLKRSESLTYLGEVLHESGLAASASATVDLRVSRVRGAIFEIKALCEDYRMQICGGMVGAISLYIRLEPVYTHPVREKLLSAKGVFSSHAFLLELGGLHEFSCSAPS